MGNSMTMLGGFLVGYFIILFFVLALSIAFYVFSSLGLYSHAKRHNIKNPWLAWLPIGNYWVYGMLSDLATAYKRDKKMQYSKWMLGLSAGMTGATVIYLILVLVMTFNMIGSAVYDPDMMLGSMFGFIAILMVFYFLLYAAMIALYIIWSIGMYHVYRMYCTKGISITFAILGGIFGLHGIFLFAIRNKPVLPPDPQQPIYTTYTNVPPQGWPQGYYNPQQPPQTPPQGYYPPQNPQG